MSYDVLIKSAAPRSTLAGGKTRAQGDRSFLAKSSILVLCLVLVATIVLSLAAGASDASIVSLIGALFTGIDSTADALSLRDRIIIYDIRLPRVILGALIGASLAVSGAVMQGLFRNPLADPGIVGVSAGAGLGAVSMIVLGGTFLAPLIALFGFYALPLAAFFGALAFTLILYRVATRRGQTSIATMLLAGIALGAMAGAYMGVLVYIADDRQLRDLTFWGLGSLAGANWVKIAAAGPFIVSALLISPFLARGLNGLALGEAAASHLGIPVQRFKRIAIVVVAGATGASVAVSGGIGFVGVVVPHLLRLMIGPDHRYLLPAAALLGASLLLLADAVSRTIVAPSELPIGIVTAAVGAPFFLWILLRRRGILDLRQ
ncbi:iron ABC transporter permease (plasmid) [Phyllobacterium sp. A18/5-2]|uniref:FecCD family ABC transporter permease n=1 Tax=Phyllobacterium sp. A18/5-2 TaxID=2978392 RepID=UPI0021C97B58|nr:iron ABC transporter permease [Phyllobacterium sp. A18/5-2]UXN66986.1 iron ABC transporter permease [Phyllobacterium sp. A18/5-2]